jgi:hypothetical protein
MRIPPTTVDFRMLKVTDVNLPQIGPYAHVHIAGKICFRACVVSLSWYCPLSPPLSALGGKRTFAYVAPRVGWMRIELNCAECGNNSFDLGRAAEDNSLITAITVGMKSARWPN